MILSKDEIKDLKMRREVLLTMNLDRFNMRKIDIYY
jgi:hypothetical protein